MGDVNVRPLRWGIIGSGRVADGFATDLRRLDGCELVAVASRRRRTAADFADRHGAPRVHDTYDSLATDPDIDVVYVATPNHRHADDALSCLHHGKAVLCEKPFTTSADDARRVVETARANGLFCMEAMWMRFVPAVRRAADLVAAGRIGEPTQLHADFSSPSPVEPRSRLFDPAQGGGALLDLGVYPLSLAQLLLGEPAEVEARLHVGPTGVDEHATVMLGYASGATAVLTSSLRSRGPNAAWITGTEGTIELPGPICAPTRLRFVPTPTAADGSSGGRLRRVVDDHPALSFAARAARRAARAVAGVTASERLPVDGHGYGYEALEAAQCMRDGRLESALMPLDDSVRTVELVERIRRDAGLTTAD